MATKKRIEELEAAGFEDAMNRIDPAIEYGFHTDPDEWAAYVRGYKSLPLHQEFPALKWKVKEASRL